MTHHDYKIIFPKITTYNYNSIQLCELGRNLFSSTNTQRRNWHLTDEHSGSATSLRIRTSTFLENYRRMDDDFNFHTIRIPSLITWIIQGGKKKKYNILKYVSNATISTRYRLFTITLAFEASLRYST